MKYEIRIRLFIRTCVKSALFLLSEESQKKLLMQICYVNHCNSSYTPLGPVLGVIQKLNQKSSTNEGLYLA